MEYNYSDPTKADALGLIAPEDEEGRTEIPLPHWQKEKDLKPCVVHGKGLHSGVGVELWFGWVCRPCLIELVITRRVAVVPSNLEAAFIDRMFEKPAVVEDDGTITVGDVQVSWT